MDRRPERKAAPPTPGAQLLDAMEQRKGVKKATNPGHIVHPFRARTPPRGAGGAGDDDGPETLAVQKVGASGASAASTAAACIALMMALDDEEDEVPDAGKQARAGQVGGVAALMAALRAHPSSPAVQEAGMDALSSLAWRHEAHCADVRGALGVSAALDALRAHREHGGVQQQGCWLLMVLARFGGRPACEEIVEAKGVADIALVVKTHNTWAQREEGCDEELLAKEEEGKVW